VQHASAAGIFGYVSRVPTTQALDGETLTSHQQVSWARGDDPEGGAAIGEPPWPRGVRGGTRGPVIVRISDNSDTCVQDEISPETMHADLRHEPDPLRKAERERLGLLGRLATFVCLIEIYGHAPSAAEFRACRALRRSTHAC